jgi:hypothetical protein
MAAQGKQQGGADEYVVTPAGAAAGGLMAQGMGGSQQYGMGAGGGSAAQRSVGVMPGQSTLLPPTAQYR